MVKACCPECGKILVVRLDGTFPRHSGLVPGEGYGLCPASFWMVEGPEVVAA